MTESLDTIFLRECTVERLQGEYWLYKKVKTDDWKEWNDEPEINIKIGADGVDWKSFEKQLDHLTNSIVKRIRKGTYLFYPFREIIKSKDPKLKNPFKVLEKGKERILSIAGIRDILVQKVLYDAIYDRAEQQFNQLPEVSFGYRKGRSAPLAARTLYQHIRNGYVYVLDADISKFFDKIPHNQLMKVIEDFTYDSPIVQQLLKRFVRVDRIEWLAYKGNEWKFRKHKLRRIKRCAGIPQGGILSGLIANLYLHSFDEWVCCDLGSEYDIRYVRYADDFVILTKKYSQLPEIKEKVRIKLEELGLTLHTDVKKTKIIDLSKKRNYVEFVGFAISETGIRIKNENLRRFKERIQGILRGTEISDLESLKLLIRKLSFKFFGNHAKKRICIKCSLQEPRRSWLNFFLTITDVQQLRALDYWVRKKIYEKYYRETGKRLSRKTLKKLDFPSLERLYYEYRKRVKKGECFCKCDPLEREYILEEDLIAELMKY